MVGSAIALGMARLQKRCNEIMSDYSIVVNHRYLGCNVLNVVANDAPLWHLILRSWTILNILTDWRYLSCPACVKSMKQNSHHLSISMTSNCNGNGFALSVTSKKRLQSIRAQRTQRRHEQYNQQQKPQGWAHFAHANTATASVRTAWRCIRKTDISTDIEQNPTY